MFSYKKINIFLIFFLISGNFCDSVTEAEDETTEEPGILYNGFFFNKNLKKIKFS